eukprot:TRINITY_DN19161_c0_g1_i1.p1 TRINITY_DN19161_c0_g1~~TRINITY_DN19161_c0_g1_i1.p1  ORF type:complete len:371 (+),score=98.57 TRINITY_DN19161_c0_g1_i1:83-1114(+)
MPALPGDHSAAQTVGALVSGVLLYPIDQVRTLQQLRGGRRQSARAALIQLLRDGGAPAVYAGLSGTLVALCASTALYSWMLQRVKDALLRVRGRPSGVSEGLLVAFAVGVANSVCTSPLWVASTRLRLQAQRDVGARGSAPSAPAAAGESSPAALSPGWAPRGGGEVPQAAAAGAAPHYDSFAEALIDVVRSGDAFRGIASSVLLCTNPAIQFVCYEQLRRRVIGERIAIDPGSGFAFGAAAKALATVATYPLQLVQTRSRVSHASMWQIVSDVLATDGPAGLFRGMGPKLAQTVLNSALMSAIYESILGLMVRTRQHRVTLACAVGAALLLLHARGRSRRRP